MSRGVKITIDGDKLKGIFKAMGKTVTAVSEEMGYGHAALGVKLGKNYLMNRDIVFLEKIYGIKPEYYMPTEVEEPKTETAISTLTQAQIEKAFANALDEYDAIDYERLYKVIYSATYEAMKKALGDDGYDE